MNETVLIQLQKLEQENTRLKSQLRAGKTEIETKNNLYGTYVAELSRVRRNNRALQLITVILTIFTILTVILWLR